MPVPKVGKLTPESVDALMRRIHETPSLRHDIIEELLRSGARKFLEQAFDLSRRQRNEVNLMKNRDFEEIVQRALLMALVHDGSINVVHEGHPRPNLWIRVSWNGGVSVTVGC